MKSIFAIFLAFSFFSATAQSLIYSENFNSGNGSFQLNTSDVTSTVSGYNQWLVNSTYSGGVFTEACLGFDVTIPSTANQPGSIAGSPNSGYLHISSIDALNSNVGCASFQASDGALLCNGDEAYFAKMNQDISTLGNTGVTFSFYWLCSGSVSNYGEVYYSLNGGNTWNLQSGSYYNNPNWTLATLTNAAWDNQSQLRFGFRFVNQQSFSAADPPFAVDEIKLTVPGNNGNVDAQITGVSGLSFCPGTTFDVNYSAAGTFNAPNNFSIELSDALGNFTSPQTIGSVSSTISGLITCTIPVGIAAGTNYRMRIKASNPNFTSNDFGVNFTILEAPPADFISSPTGTNLEYSFGCSVFAFVDWQWNFGDGSTGTGAGINHTFPSSGVYQVCLEATAPNGCVSTICKPVIVVATGIIENKNAMILFPNPAKSTIQLNWIETREFVEIYNSNGMLVRFIPIYSNFYELDISELNSGLYFIIDNKGVANKLIKE